VKGNGRSFKQGTRTMTLLRGRILTAERLNPRDWPYRVRDMTSEELRLKWQLTRAEKVLRDARRRAREIYRETSRPGAVKG
jgi:hypothetical protein